MIPRASILAMCVGCTGLAAPSGPPAPGFELGPEVRCEAPVDGFDRLVEVAAERGLVYEVELDPAVVTYGVDGAEVVARDLDGDGDVDLSFGYVRGLPALFANDGDGGFRRVPQPPDLYDSYRDHVANHLAADLDGDGLPELVLLSPGKVRIAWNLGDMAFSEPELVVDLGLDPLPVFLTATAADADADGDLDLFVPGLDLLGAEPTPDGPTPLPGSYDRLFLQEAGGFELAAELAPADTPGFSLAALFTDRDGDGDPDLLVASDRAQFGMPRTAFYRNDGAAPDGVPALIDDASELSAALAVSGMGFTTTDHDGDGRFDYCITDIGGVRCLLSRDDGGYVESAPAMGLVPPPEATSPAGWYLWSMEMEDLDNDGELDAVSAGGLPLSIPEELAAMLPQPDAIWQGTGPGAFVDRTGAVGFGDLRYHIGLAAADLDGDGFLEVVISGVEGPVLLYDNPCGSGAWLEVALVGPAANRDGIGARVEVETDGRTRAREVQTLRSLGQSPARVHVGLGGAAQADVRIRWPDGAISAAEGVGVRRRIVVRHPDAQTARSRAPHGSGGRSRSRLP